MNFIKIKKSDERGLVMTFGGKLKKARKEAGLTQEQLAEKISVSRSAVAKWETDKGMPDIDNLRLISELVGVSIDYLLDEQERISFNETRESVNLEDYKTTGKCRDKRDAACFAKYHDASAIIPLVRSKKLNVKEQIVDFIVQPGILAIGDHLNTGLIGFYLVERNNKQYLVSVSKDFLTTRELPEKIHDNKFVIGKYRYKRAGYVLI